MIVLVYVDDETHQNDDNKEGYKSLWVRFELPKNLPSNIDNKEYRIREEKYHYHCNQKLFAVSHLILLDRDEETVYDSGSFDPYLDEYSKSWKLISPKSGPDLIYQYLCSNKLKIPSPEQKTASHDKKDLLPKQIIINEQNNMAELDIKNIRWAKHKGFERLVFDIYNGKNPVKKPEIYNVTKLDDKNKLKVEVDDLKSVSAKFPNIKKSSILKKIYKKQNINESEKANYYIYIDFEESSDYKFFTMQEPGRIVIDFRDKKQN